jgi:hypothetical protein
MARLIVNGLFDSEHYWVLSRKASGGTNIVHGENFRGLLMGVIKPGWLKGEFEGINRKHGGGDRAPPSVLRRHGAGSAARGRGTMALGPPPSLRRARSSHCSN